MAVVSDRSAACVCCLPIVLSVRVLGTAWLCALHMAVRDPLRPPSGGHCPSGMQHDVGAHGDGSSSGAAGEGLQCLSNATHSAVRTSFVNDSDRHFAWTLRAPCCDLLSYNA